MKQEIQRRIEKHIAHSGYHVYVVSGGQSPRFAYTVGLKDLIGSELVLAGAVFYMLQEVLRIVGEAATHLKGQCRSLEVKDLGTFAFRSVHNSWTKALLLGALDFYAVSDIAALQIVPDDAHWTVDVPQMDKPRSAKEFPIWRWLDEPWPHHVPSNSTCVTNLSALRGGRTTEVMRWEQDEWEIFAGAGPDVTKDQLRVVPMGTLLGVDMSLLPALDLPTGQGLWRDPEPGSQWHEWRSPTQQPN